MPITKNCTLNLFTTGISAYVEDPWIHGLMMTLRDKGNIDDNMIADGVLEDISFHTSQYPTAIHRTSIDDKLHHEQRINYPEEFYDFEEQ